MDTHNSGLYHEVTNSGGEGRYSGGLQQVVKNDTLCGNNRRDIGRGTGKVVQRQCMKATWATQKCGIRQRAPVCSRINEGTEQDVGNKNKAVNSIPPTDRQADRMDKLRA